MKEDRIILQITAMEEGTAVKLNMTKEDVTPVALAFFDIYSKYPEILECVQAICMMSILDKDFEKRKKAGTIEMPDFDQILKDTK